MKNKTHSSPSQTGLWDCLKGQKQEADARLEALLIEGLDSGKDIELTRDFWKDMKAEASHLLKKHRKASA